MRRLTWLAFVVLLAGCGASNSARPLPTASIRLVTPNPAIRVAVALPTTAPTIKPPSPTADLPTPKPPQPAASAPTTLDQYRAWMEEARALHPYDEPVDAMWRVMLCESSGNADAVAGIYHGLFQYDPSTWAGDWNPYRDQPILDPRAQIFATAKAWSDGSQGWWGCYE